MSPFDKVHVVLSNGITVVLGNSKASILYPSDSCLLAPNGVREIINHGTQMVNMLVIMNYSEEHS